METIEKSLKDKIKVVRQFVQQFKPTVTNDEIILVLEHFNNDVKAAQNAFFEDGGSEVLNQWQQSGQKPSVTKPKKKKKKTNRLPEVEASNITTDLGLSKDSTVSDLSTSVLTTTSSTEGSVSTVEIIKKEDAGVAKGGIIVNGVGGKGKITAEKTKQKEDYKNKTKKERDRTLSEISTISTDKGPGKPLSGVEKSYKELEKQMSSFKHMRTTFSDGLERSYKRVHEVFKELRIQFNDREAELIFQLDKVKEQGGELLSAYETRASQLKQQTNRTSNMKENELATLRANIKAYVGEKKSYEDLVSSPRFVCEFNQMLLGIQNFGDVPKLKISSEVTIMSSTTEKSKIENISTTASTLPTVAPPSIASSLIINQSESLTRYEMAATTERLANLSLNITDLDKVKKSDTSSFRPSSRGNRGGRSRGTDSNRSPRTDPQNSPQKSTSNTTDQNYRGRGRGRGSQNQSDQGRQALPEQSSGAREQGQGDTGYKGRGDSNRGQGRGYRGGMDSSNGRGGRGRRDSGRGAEQNGGRMYDKRTNVGNESVGKSQESKDGVDGLAGKSNGENLRSARGGNAGGRGGRSSDNDRSASRSSNGKSGKGASESRSKRESTSSGGGGKNDDNSDNNKHAKVGAADGAAPEADRVVKEDGRHAEKKEASGKTKENEDGSHKEDAVVTNGNMGHEDEGVDPKPQRQPRHKNIEVA